MEMTELKGGFRLMPAEPGRCAICAGDHKPTDAHNPTSLFYGVRFEGLYGRSPTWADAAAHLSPKAQAAWREAVEGAGQEWGDPPGGPIAEPYEVAGELNHYSL